MFFYQDGRLYVPGASFPIPNGFFINTAPSLMDEDGIVLVHFKPHFEIYIHYECDASSSQDALSCILDDLEEFTLLRPIALICRNGLVGHSMAYQVLRHAYYEERLQLSGGGQLSIAVAVAARNASILQSAPDGEIFGDVLCGVRAESLRLPACNSINIY